MAQHVLERAPKPPLPEQQQEAPGLESEMAPRPDYGEKTYRGCGKLKGKAAIITGGDSGIGRAVALAYAREGADVLIAYLNEESDARETARGVEKEGRKCITAGGDIRDEAHCRGLVERAVREFGKIDVLVNNAAFQMTRESLDDISTEEFDRTFKTNVYALFWLCKAAVPYMPRGGAIINTTSVNLDMPKPTLLPYAATKGAIQNLTGGLAQLLAEKGIRVNCVAPGPVWTPLNPSDQQAEQVSKFGSQVPYGRPAQPEEIAPAYVFFASDGDSSYVTGEILTLLGGETSAG